VAHKRLRQEEPLEIRPLGLDHQRVYLSTMTLNLTIVSSAGVWQCSDHRLVELDPRSGQVVRVIDDFSVKHVIFRCPDGSALLAYSGRAWLLASYYLRRVGLCKPQKRSAAGAHPPTAPSI
jgi:hypothetical protein